MADDESCYVSDTPFPFCDAFEEDTGTFPFGTLSAIASHVTTLPATSDAAALLARLKQGDTFVDLGCGVGRVVERVAATVGKDCRCVGVDMCEGEIEVAREVGGRGEYHVDDVFNAEAVIKGEGGGEVEWERVVVFIFLIPKLVNSREFKKMLHSFIERGARVVSYCYHVDGWKVSQRERARPLQLNHSQFLSPLSSSTPLLLLP